LSNYFLGVSFLSVKQSQLRKTLAATEAQLEKAKLDLGRAQQKVQTLTQRIPELQRAVDSLRVLVGAKPSPKASPSPQSAPRAVVDKSDLARLAGPQDLTGMGSVPYGSGPQAPQLSEDEILPDPEGDPILE
jgi:uncharacterized protein YlxW (UPF0749 family)